MVLESGELLESVVIESIVCVLVVSVGYVREDFED